MIRLQRYPLSGHAHRVELFLSLIGLEHELVDRDPPPHAKAWLRAVEARPGFIGMRRSPLAA